MERGMFDTMTMTKTVGALCGTLLVYLLGGWTAELIYHGSGGHDEHAQAYVIEVEGADEAEDVVEGPAFEEVFAMADAAAGEAAFRPCSACHQLEQGANGVGPYLYGVVGRPKNSAEGYAAYSGALNDGEIWTPENLNAFLENPRAYAPGTSMNYNGMRRIEDRANLIAYLDSLDG